MVGKRGWFESLQTTSRVPSSTSVEQSDKSNEGFKGGNLPAYNSAFVYIISSVQHALPAGFKCLQVHTLFKETITLAVHPKCRVRDVYLCCCTHLKMKESWLLGLASRTPSEGFGSDRPRHEYYFLDSSCKVAKYGPKHWRFNYPWASHLEGRPFLVLHLRVRIYVSDAHIIRCPVVLKYYYLQLRENLLDQWSTPESVSEERCWKMASVAYEADSVRDSQLETGETRSSYFRPERYFPLWVINTRGLDYVRRNLRNIENGQNSRSREEAIQEFCEQASSSPFALNCHLYGLRQYKVDTVDNAFLGITPNGLEMSDVGDDGGRNLRQILQWGDIVLLSFDKRKLKMLGANGNCTCLYAHSEEKARYLFEFCRIVHQAIIRINQYFHSCREQFEPIKDSLLLSPEVVPTELLLLRQSPVSRVSSNSTSGVVSDKPSSETERDYDWMLGSATAEALSSNNVSPKSLMEQSDLHLPQKSAEEIRRADVQFRGDIELRTGVAEEQASVKSQETNFETSLPRPSIFDAAIKRLSLMDDGLSGSAPACDSISEKSFPKPPPIDTTVGKHASDSHCFEKFEERQLLALHLSHKLKYESLGQSSSSPPRALVPDGEIIEDDVNLGIPISLTAYPDTDGCARAEVVENPLRSTIEVSEAQSDTGSNTHLLRLSNSKSIDRQGEDVSTTWLSRPEVLREKLPCDVGIKMPPLYAEAVALSKNHASNGRSPTNVKVHPKQRWKTVADVTAPLDYSNTERCQQFRYFQALMRSEPKLDLQLLSRSASPPPALHLSMQQLPIVPSQQFVVHPTGVPGKFQKQPRCLTRISRSSNPSGISRVQSMPAHPAPIIQLYDVGNNDSSAMLHHAQSLAVRPLSAENKKPPSYEFAIQQVRARHAQQATGSAPIRSPEQPTQIPQGTFCSTKSGNDASLKDFPFMALLLQEHQQENIDLLSQNNTIRSQGPSDSGSRATSQFVNDMVSTVNDECMSESPSSDIRDMRTPLLTTPSALKEVRSHRPFHLDLFDEVVFGDDDQYSQRAEIYHTGCCSEHPTVFRQYAPYIAEQQAAQASWNPIPPPPPYPQSRSSAAALEAPMVM